MSDFGRIMIINNVASIYCFYRRTERIDLNGKLEKPFEAPAFSKKAPADSFHRDCRNPSELFAHAPGPLSDRATDRQSIAGE